MKTKFTIKDFHIKYPDEKSCLDEIFRNRYGKTKLCPDCGKSTKFHRVSNRKCYACQFCGYQLHPLADTIFHKSDTSLKNWFFAIFLFANSKNGVSGKAIQRYTGVTYKTAWRMGNQIRLLFAKSGGMLSKTVEIDDTYIGGVKRGKRGRGAGGKTIVFGAIQREGNVRAEVTPNLKTATIMPMVHDTILFGSQIMSDEFGSYRNLGKRGYTHCRVDHGAEEYARGNVHTNTIEGFWSQLKRSINGTYHAVSPKYLQNYVDEFSYRYNHRNEPSSVFSSMLGEVAKRV